MSRVRRLKTQPETDGIVHAMNIEDRYFEQLIAGNKTAEVRKNDRDFQAGDIIDLYEVYVCNDEDGDNVHTGRQALGIISHVSNYGQVNNMVVLSLTKICYTPNKDSASPAWFAVINNGWDNESPESVFYQKGDLIFSFEK